jgi:hypothetical protein
MISRSCLGGSNVAKLVGDLTILQGMANQHVENECTLSFVAENDIVWDSHLGPNPGRSPTLNRSQDAGSADPSVHVSEAHQASGPEVRSGAKALPDRSPEAAPRDADCRVDFLMAALSDGRASPAEFLRGRPSWKYPPSHRDLAVRADIRA